MKQNYLEIFLFALLLIINLFFGVFIWKPSNFFLHFVISIVTIIPIIFLGIRIFKKMIPNTKKEKQ